MARFRSTDIARSLLSLAALWAGCRNASPPREPFPLPPVPAAELERLDRTSPVARAHAQRAEEALAAGRVEQAETLYAQAVAAAPRAPLPHRRRCELLTRLGRRDQALKACSEAMQWGGSVYDLRATVAAIVSAPRQLTVDEVVDAQMLAEGARRLMPGQPQAYAATADIARRIGDPALLRASVAELQRIAPDHPETRRALALMPSSFGWLRALGWVALVLGIAWVVARGRRRRSRETVGAGSIAEPG